MDQSNLNPCVAIIGRPNVGKSTLFNLLVGIRSSIVSDVYGTTRDRVNLNTSWGNRIFTLVDTGGLDVDVENSLWLKVKNQIYSAIDEADVLVMVVDASIGITSSDRYVADVVRKSGKPLVLAANKSDNELREMSASEFFELGLTNPIPISAYHNIGIDDLMSQLLNLLPTHEEYDDFDVDLKFSLIGRANVGKSMLMNSILNEDRSIVHGTPGTTRDSLDSKFIYQDRDILLIDTAGIRRSGKIESGVEKYSVLRTLQSIDRSDVCALVMDATELATSQDTHVASHILNAFKGVVLVVNKWDLASELSMKEDDIKAKIMNKFKFLNFAPICFTSGLNGEGLDELIKNVIKVNTEWSKRVPRYDLRRIITTAIGNNPPSNSGKRLLKIHSVSQDKVAPPSFTFYVNNPDLVHFSYKRYLENCLRDAYSFLGSPIRMRFKKLGKK
ncbi:MAG: ribosome biogenesis GTPase Der [Chloroflexi bacterium]|nr:ribosome biogenesis GTPase Der [Chloroflexota bacterium]MCH2304345.1 ribosome biogenesis GTPase Der [SAR202 cluster bacterium]|tara:strand:- start:32771 stop:34102 length:1332 start_codon:yes stop_codon:yes gene_type:complete